MYNRIIGKRPLDQQLESFVSKAKCYQCKSDMADYEGTPNRRAATIKGSCVVGVNPIPYTYGRLGQLAESFRLKRKKYRCKSVISYYNK